MALQGLVILRRALFQIQPGTDQSGMIGVPQGVMGGAGGLNAKHLHGRLQGFLGGRAIGLGVEDHLRVIPPLRKGGIQIEKLQIFPQDPDIVKAPGQEHNVRPAPIPEQLHRLREGHPLLPKPGLLDSRQLTDPAVEMAVVLGLDHDLKFIRHLLRLGDPHRADLNDFSADRNRQRLLGRRRSGPGLVPFHIHHDVIHCQNLCVI